MYDICRRVVRWHSNSGAAAGVAGLTGPSWQAKCWLTAALTARLPPRLFTPQSQWRGCMQALQQLGSHYAAASTLDVLSRITCNAQLYQAFNNKQGQWRPRAMEAPGNGGSRPSIRRHLHCRTQIKCRPSALYLKGRQEGVYAVHGFQTPTGTVRWHRQHASWTWPTGSPRGSSRGSIRLHCHIIC
jgi:hypothetical protein